MCFAVLTLYTRTMYFSLSAFCFREDSTTLTVVFVVPAAPAPTQSIHLSHVLVFYRTPTVAMAPVVPSTLWPSLERLPPPFAGQAGFCMSHVSPCQQHKERRLG